MSVVAGCLLFDGVLLAADCRVTFPRPGLQDIHVDYAQKLFPVAPGTAIGFVGDVRAASRILSELLLQVRRRRHRDPVSLGSWMPRLFQAVYSGLPDALQASDVRFMVASSFPDRLNVVERETVAQIVRRIGWGHSPVQRSWLPSILIQILSVPPEHQRIAIPGTTRGALYTMRAPDFIPQPCRPLHFAAIGSGEEVYQEIADLHDVIVAGQPGNTSMEVTWFRTAIETFLRHHNIPTVGGLLPALKVRGRQIDRIGMSRQIPIGGTRIELTLRNDSWIQRNVTTGRELALLFPWEIPASATEEQVFDDLERAYQQFSSPR